ncbi:MAG: 2,5-diamino-6-(ribosylamino)-4(3H)-pyrimidinone 5'-phosphate reductase [Nitrososphaeraceae archaeon]|nr:2,5-diamino-6-(ribosylamino)-4(3H)-pyrimidinone 5'-phosphate reductase [Nitrososphaeraceae archaeon]
MSIKSDLRVIINSAMTVDGKISTISGDSKISSKEDLVRLHKLRSKVDAIMVGINTVIIDNPMLNVRINNIKKKSPSRIIIDSTGKIPLNSKILRSASQINTIIIVTKEADKDIIDKINSFGAKVLVIGTKSVNLPKLFNILYEMGYKKILVEGGGELNWSCITSGLVTDLILTISPKIIGGKKAITLVEGSGYSKISNGVNLQLVRVTKKKNNEIILYYKL